MEHIRLGADIVAGGITIGAILGWFPPMSALLSIIWLSIQIYDRLTKGRK